MSAVGWFPKPIKDKSPYTTTLRVIPIEGGGSLRLLDGRYEPTTSDSTEISLVELRQGWSITSTPFPDASAFFVFTAKSLCRAKFEASVEDSDGEAVPASDTGTKFSTQFTVNSGKSVIVVVYFT